MPYINVMLRERLDPLIDELVDCLIEEADSTKDGVANYVVSCLVTRIIGGELSYRRVARMVAVLECAKLELYRRLAAPYEDRAMQTNGDIPPYSKGTA